jgi:hypothetical protein
VFWLGFGGKLAESLHTPNPVENLATHRQQAFRHPPFWRYFVLSRKIHRNASRSAVILSPLEEI